MAGKPNGVRLQGYWLSKSQQETAMRTGLNTRLILFYEGDFYCKSILKPQCSQDTSSYSIFIYSFASPDWVFPEEKKKKYNFLDSLVTFFSPACIFLNTHEFQWVYHCKLTVNNSGRRQKLMKGSTS